MLIISFAAFFTDYEKPKQLFWDENYHIASSQKYIDGVFFLEHHPPLGKLLIAAGEKIVNANKDLDLSSFNTVDHLDNIPKGYSFRGVRLMPVLALIASSVLLFFILFELSKNTILSVIFSCLFLFDNAIIIHSRAAHLEPFQFLFIFACLFIFCRSLINENKSFTNWMLMGVFAGLAISAKLNSAIVLILFFTRYIYELFPLEKKPLKTKAELIQISKVFCSLLALFLVVMSTYYIHFRLARTPLQKRFYASKQVLRDSILRDDVSLKSFAIFMKENIRYIKRFSDGVPRLRPDSPKENGSHPIFWPIGKKSINYRWDKTKDGRVIHHQLQANPIGWGISLLAIVLSLGLIISRRIFGLEIRKEKQNTYRVIETLSFMWIAYMFVMMNMGRVMYLYHYLIPLCFGFILALQIFSFLFQNHRKKLSLQAGLICLLLAQFLCFWHFRHFAYQIPLTPEQYAQRDWLEIWRYKNVFW